ERDIKAEQRKMQDDQEEAKQKLSRINDDLTVALYKKVRDAAARYAKAHNFDLVMHYTDAAPDDKDYFSPANVARRFQAGTSMPLYWKPDMDISKPVVDALNAVHHAADAPSRGTGSEKD